MFTAPIKWYHNLYNPDMAKAIAQLMMLEINDHLALGMVGL
jgi:hypothetical protein